MNNQLTFMRQDFGSASCDTVKIPIKNEILPL